MTVFFLIAIVIVAGSFGDIVLSRSMKQIGAIDLSLTRETLRLVWRAAIHPGVHIGVANMAAAFFALLAALSIAPVSLVEPATAVSFVINTLGAKFLLNERVDRTRWLGTIFVSVGAALLAL
jgi:drug/metabolite transporter (DMT)-like permease